MRAHSLQPVRCQPITAACASGPAAWESLPCVRVHIARGLRRSTERAVPWKRKQDSQAEKSKHVEGRDEVDLQL